MWHIKNVIQPDLRKQLDSEQAKPQAQQDAVVIRNLQQARIHGAGMEGWPSSSTFHNERVTYPLSSGWRLANGVRAHPLHFARVQGIRGWSQIMTIYNDMTTLAKNNDEALPNYQVSRARRVVGWHRTQPFASCCARQSAPRRWLHVRRASSCRVSLASQVGQQEVNGMIQGSVESVWHNTLDMNDDR